MIKNNPLKKRMTKKKIKKIRKQMINIKRIIRKKKKNTKKKFPMEPIIKKRKLKIIITKKKNLKKKNMKNIMK